jgi:hypothetical protein
MTELTNRRRPCTRRAVGGLLVGATAALLWVPAGPAIAKDTVAATQEQAEHQAALVDQEDRRLIQVRAVTAIAPLQGANWTKPYRLDTGGGYTLVLTQKTDDYTVADLLELAPQTFVRQPDGGYLLTENIYLNSGAKLRLTNPGGLTIRLASNSNGFVSIVSFGGKLILEGSPQAATVITSWDPRTNQPDTDLNDGRAYVRAIGGRFSMSYTTISNLGFWSGRTGGLSLTGTDRPNTGDVDGPVHLTKDQRHEAKANRLAHGPAKSNTPPTSGGVVAQPSGPLTTPDSRFSVPGQSYISVEIRNSRITGNAFGLFISSANGITIADSTVENNREDGVVMHRFASSAVLERTTSRNNGGDGFVLSRATEQVRISGATAEGNGGNGFTLSGQALATGPSASGESTENYGSNSVSNSVARNNGHYGIEVLGGFDVGVQNNHVEGSDMGIVARHGAQRVAITGNRLRGQARQGIAIRDGAAATVTGNIVEKTDTGIYVRNSAVEIRGNTVQHVSNHGVTMVGDTTGSTISYNVIGGVGPSAIDASRTDNRLAILENQTFAWHDTSSFWIRLRHYASPMTMLWTAILLLIVFSAIMGKRRVTILGGRHPYADNAPLNAAGAKELAIAGPRAVAE